MQNIKADYVNYVVNRIIGHIERKEGNLINEELPNENDYYYEDYMEAIIQSLNEYLAEFKELNDSRSKTDDNFDDFISKLEKVIESIKANFDKYLENKNIAMDASLEVPVRLVFAKTKAGNATFYKDIKDNVEKENYNEVLAWLLLLHQDGAAKALKLLGNNAKRKRVLELKPTNHSQIRMFLKRISDRVYYVMSVVTKKTIWSKKLDEILDNRIRQLEPDYKEVKKLLKNSEKSKELFEESEYKFNEIVKYLRENARGELPEEVKLLLGEDDDLEINFDLLFDDREEEHVELKQPVETPKVKKKSELDLKKEALLKSVSPLFKEGFMLAERVFKAGSSVMKMATYDSKLRHWLDIQSDRILNNEISNAELELLTLIGFDNNEYIKLNENRIKVHKHPESQGGRVLKSETEQIDSSWITMFNQIKKMLQQNTALFDVHNNWIEVQKQKYREGKLNKMQIKLLQSCNLLDVTVKDELFMSISKSWLNTFNEIKHIIDSGDIKIVVMDSNYRRWIINQLKDYKAVKLNQRQIQYLNSIGIDLSLIDTDWLFSYLDTLKILTNSGSVEGFDADEWLEEQKSADMCDFQKKLISEISYLQAENGMDEQDENVVENTPSGSAEDELEEILREGTLTSEEEHSFDKEKPNLKKEKVTPVSRDWFAFYTDLKDTLSTFGPKPIVMANKYKSWLSRQISKYEDGKLGTGEFNYLMKIGIDLSKLTTKWMDDYVSVLNNVNNFSDKLDPSLNGWLKKQFENNEKGMLCDFQIQLLSNIGYSFSNNNKESIGDVSFTDLSSLNEEIAEVLSEVDESTLNVPSNDTMQIRNNIENERRRNAALRKAKSDLNGLSLSDIVRVQNYITQVKLEGTIVSMTRNSHDLFSYDELNNYLDDNLPIDGVRKK